MPGVPPDYSLWPCDTGTAGPAWASGKGGCYQTKPRPADNNYKLVPEGTGEQPEADAKGGESTLRKYERHLGEFPICMGFCWGQAPASAKGGI